MKEPISVQRLSPFEQPLSSSRNDSVPPASLVPSVPGGSREPVTALSRTERLPKGQAQAHGTRQSRAHRFQQHLKRRRELTAIKGRGGFEGMTDEASRVDMDMLTHRLEQEARELMPDDMLVRQAEQLDATDYCHGGEEWLEADLEEQAMLEEILALEEQELASLTEMMDLQDQSEGQGEGQGGSVQDRGNGYNGQIQGLAPNLHCLPADHDFMDTD